MKISRQIVIEDTENESDQFQTYCGASTIHKAQISRKRRKTLQFGVKERGSRLFKYLQEKQKAFLDYQPGEQVSIFTTEEDRILIILVKKLGPNFSKISKYFPAKTVNMLKNRYYKHLRFTQTTETLEDLEREIQHIDNTRIEGRRILKIWPKKSNQIIESSPLFPEAEELLHTLFQHFQIIVEKVV